MKKSKKRVESNKVKTTTKSVKKAIIDSNICDRFIFCPVKRACPVKAITQQKVSFFKANVPVIDADACIGCGKCIPVCPHGAVKMKSVKIKA
ncbi:4Fe-4S dicluster domain-containing protein [Helicovermis profundi]|uniref:4Fe-4S ferredoxin-type domain-containing protein n=1 Tax=Helicovermis profundi TaxID=3065157 RepID=A0AAU9EE06_9FIRM|nr:hypothetical protein HLPR_19900 [Clostridia bacterium S502]